MAFDHPDPVKAVLDIVPTWEAYQRADMAFGMSFYFRWFFMTQPFDLPERLIGADRVLLEKAHLARAEGRGFFRPKRWDYLRCRNPAIPRDLTRITAQRRHRYGDRRGRSDAGRKNQAPMLALWGRTVG
jgi:haloacetate dehalogenase